MHTHLNLGREFFLDAIHFQFHVGNNTLWAVTHFVVFQVDPSTGEAEDDGVEDEYQLEDLEIVSADYMLKVGVSNFRNAWENMDPESERVDEYGLGVREGLAEAVSAVIGILGMQPCEVSLSVIILFAL